MPNLNATPEPIFRTLDLSSSDRRWSSLVDDLNNGELDDSPAYQRELVWTEEQQVKLIESLSMGAPVPGIIVNQRDSWGVGTGMVIDGKQRLNAVRRFLAGELEIPAWWMPAELVDGKTGQVNFKQFTVPGQRIWKSHAIVTVFQSKLLDPNAEAKEAKLFGLINTGGKLVSPETLAQAARIADQL